MEFQTNIEQISFLWSIAFMVDVLVGSLCLVMVLRRNTAQRYRGSLWWMGWWSYASAFTLLINIFVSPDNPFSYHQVGILVETMFNVGAAVFMLIFLLHNHRLVHTAWDEVDQFKKEITRDQ